MIETNSKTIIRIYRRINNYNKNFLMIICGETGSGKSYAALRFGEVLDETFTIDRVVFTAEDFMKLINSGELKKGMVIIWDEAGVGIPSKEWWTISNKAINYVLQTFRRENLIVIFTTPTISFIDAGARRLFHAYIETQKINFKKNQCIAKFMNMQLNPRFGKVYYKYGRGFNGKIEQVKIKLPSKKLIKQYEKKKLDFAKTLYQDVEDDLQKIREGKEERKLTIEDMARLAIKKKDFFLKEDKRHNRMFIDTFLLMNNFDIGMPKAKQIKRIVEQQLSL